MRILDPSGRDAQVVSLGDDLILRIELRDQNHSPYAIFARNLYARSSNGESLYLIDNNGCPIDSSIFPALQLDSIDHRSLYSKFKAFRFPSTGVVNFEVQIRFCQEYCEPVKCTQLNGHVDSFGRRRRRSVNSFQELFLHHQPSMKWQTNRINMNDGDNITKHLNQSQENWARINLLTNHHGLLNMDQINQSSLKPGNNWTSSNEFSRSRTGFTYPTNNYRYYRNRNNFSIGHGVGDSKKTDDFNSINEYDSQIFSTPSILFSGNVNVNKSNENIDNANVDSATTAIESYILGSNNNNNNYTINEMHNVVYNERNNITDDIMTPTTTTMMMANFNPIGINAALPLPTSNLATEVPLSLAIMVDGNADDGMDNDSIGNAAAVTSVHSNDNENYDSNESYPSSNNNENNNEFNDDDDDTNEVILNHDQTDEIQIQNDEKENIFNDHHRLRQSNNLNYVNMAAAAIRTTRGHLETRNNLLAKKHGLYIVTFLHKLG